MLFFSGKGVIAGELAIHGLPPDTPYQVSIAYIAVESASSSLPSHPDPSTGLWRDSEPVKEMEEPGDRPIRFRSLRRNPGYYYLGVHVIAYSMSKGGIADVQDARFFPMTAPCRIRRGFKERVALSVTWPHSDTLQQHTP